MGQSTNTVSLAVPFEWQGQMIAEVTIRRPKVKDLRAIEVSSRDRTSQLDQGAEMLAKLTGLPIEAVDELDAQDFTAISEVIAGFFPQAKGRATGAE